MPSTCNDGPVPRRWTLGTALGVAAPLLAPAVVLAHGGLDLPAPSIESFVLGWGFDATVWLPVIGLALAWRWAVSRVARDHPNNPVPPRRSVYFALGLLTILVALDSGLARYDDTLFSAHMVQHLMLTLVAPPLLALAAPITLLLRVASPSTRRSLLLPVLHSRAVKVLAFPPVAWILFAAVMWGSHFSPLFDAALEDGLVHRLEHALYLGSALLFWWPVVGADPAPWRMSWPARLLYAGLQLPQNTFLALAIYSSSSPLYHHYATLTLPWLPDALADQQVAGGIMWLGGDMLFLTSLLLGVAAWLRDEERRAVQTDRRADAELAAIREREARLAAQRSGADPQPGIGEVSSSR
jgi:cytochrome c oxidase assembly factor CtaG